MKATRGRELETSKGPNKESGKDEAKTENEHKQRMRGHPELPTWRTQYAQSQGRMRDVSNRAMNIIMTSVEFQY